MPRYFCDYCDTYLTHDSPSVRKQHNAGYKHKGNVRVYYQQYEEQQTQSLIEQRIKEHMGQASALQQVGAAYAAMQRGRPPFLPYPMMPMPGGPGLPPGAQLPPGFRPPVLPRPLPPPAYGAPPQMAPPPLAPPPSGQQTFPSMPTNGPVNIPTSISGATSTPSPNSAPSSSAQSMYHGAPGGPNFGNAPNMSAPPSFPSATGNNAAPSNNQ